MLYYVVFRLEIGFGGRQIKYNSRFLEPSQFSKLVDQIREVVHLYVSYV